MFSPAVSPTPALVLGVFFHSGDQVTVQLNDAYRNSLQLALVEAANSPVCALCITDRNTEQRQVLLIWKDEGETLNASLVAPEQVRDIANYGRNTVDKILRSGEVVSATQGIPMYLLILQGDAKDGQTHPRRAYYTTSCQNPSEELAWARQHFLYTCPSVVEETITVVFHTSRSVMHFEALNAPAGGRQWWVYVDGKPQKVAGSVAVGLFREGKIRHVCRPDEQEWRSLSAVGLVQV